MVEGKHERFESPPPPQSKIELQGLEISFSGACVVDNLAI